MNRLTVYGCIISLLLLLSLSVKGEEFVVCKVQGKNFIYGYIVRKAMQQRVDRNISIQIIGDTAFVSYNTKKDDVVFVKSGDYNNLYSAKRGKYTAKLLIEEYAYNQVQRVSFIMEKQGRKEVKVSLIASADV